MSAQLADADLERDARAGRGLLEDQRDAAAGQRLRRVPVGLQLGGALEQAGELIARKLLAGEEVPRHLGIVDGRAHRPHVEPLPRPRPSGRGVGGARRGQPRRSATSSPACSRASRGTSRSCRRRRRTGCAALAEAAGASGSSALTSRNFGAFVRRRLAEWNPDKIASGEGGSNQILARSGWRIRETRRLTLTLLPERRRLIWVAARAPRARRPDCREPARDRARSARPRRATSSAPRAPRARGRPICRSSSAAISTCACPRCPEAFEQLRAELGLDRCAAGRARSTTCSCAGSATSSAPEPLASERREVRDPDGRLVRLSDHAPVVATYDVGSPPTTSGGE